MADEQKVGFFKRFNSMFSRGSVSAEEHKTEEGDGKKNNKDCKACQVCSEQRKAKDKCIKDKGGEDMCKDLMTAYEECVKKNGGVSPAKNGKKGK